MDPYTWVYIVVLLVSAYISYENRPKTTTPKPAAFEEFEFPQFEEGTPQAVTFGDCWTKDWFVLAVGNYRTSRIRADGGK